MQEQLITLLKNAVLKLVEAGQFNKEESLFIIINVSSQSDHGDYATPLAFSLAKTQKQAPKNIAALLLSTLNPSLPAFIEKIEIAGAGYINFFIKKEYWHERLLEMLNAGSNYGKSHLYNGKKILIEFVSANPTGPLHVAHGRAAALGDTLTRLLRAVGFAVEQEYYINDVGNQVTLLGQSVLLRYRELLGEAITLPDEAYKGDYIIDIAKAIAETATEPSLRNQDAKFFGKFALDTILSWIKKDLTAFGIHFDHFFSEGSLYSQGTLPPQESYSQNNQVEKVIASLRANEMVYDADGAVWVATTRYGDDKDRVVTRSNGETTYFASDIAYHKNKLERGYDRLIDIWGADHHGYIARVKAAISAMGYQADRLDIVIHQLVNLLRGGKPVAMSKRSGEFVTLKEVIEEVGVDATRFFFLMRRSDTSLDFDLELAKKASDENPVYYVQYAHARLCSIFRVAKEQGRAVEKEIAGITKEDLLVLALPEEIGLIKQLAIYPDLVQSSAEKLEPHRINYYLMELAGLIHRYYFNCRVITNDAALTKARFALITAAQTILRSALDLLGVTAPERM
ncbi:MAG: arginine--tRNA ligase [Nitrospirota bacterium]